jgi:hypothetical protein
MISIKAYILIIFLLSACSFYLCQQEYDGNNDDYAIYVSEELLNKAFNEAAQELREQNENQFMLLQQQRKKRSLLKATGGGHQSASSLAAQSTRLSSLIHNSFMIALRVNQRLTTNDTRVTTNSSKSTIKLKAPPQFCPFSFDLSCDPNSKYRASDGSCNNLQNTLLGRSSTPYKRLLPSAYDDRINSPRQFSVRGNRLLPNARQVALSVHEPNDVPSPISNLGVMFGQFIDHDFAFSATTSGSDGSALKCTCDSFSSDCINIPTPDDDLFDTDQSCMTLTRSAASFQKFDCELDAREQTNLLTHYLDSN